MLYRIRRPNIRKVAIVKSPANGRALILKESGSAVIVAPILKAAGTDWKVAYAVVAEPGTPEGGGITADGQVAKGSDGTAISDVWETDDIREACHSFARNGAQMTAGHFTDDQAGSWVENFVAPTDMEINGRLVKAGSWVIGLDPSDETRAAIDAGTLTGFSVEGDAVREPVIHSAGDDEDGLLVALLLAKAMESENDGDTPAMERAEALAILKRQKTSNPPARAEVAAAMKCLARSSVTKAGAWDEAKHPRAPAGTSAGGKFASGKASAASSKKVPAKGSAITTPAGNPALAKVDTILSAAAKAKTAKAKTAQRQHMTRVKRHERQHVARVKAHVRAHDARVKAGNRAKVKAAASRARAAKQATAAQAAADRKAAAAAKQAAAATRATAVARAKALTPAQAKLQAMLGGKVAVAKGIGSSVPEPLGPGDLWNTPGLKLPPGVQHLAAALLRSGRAKTRSQAIATAISDVHEGCSSGRFGAVRLKPATREQTCKLSAQLKVLEAKARATPNKS